MHSFKDLNLTWVSREWRKDKQRQTHIKTGIGQSGLSARETAAPRKLSMFIIYIWTLRWGFCIQLNRRQYYYIQINNETGFMIYSWMKEEGLASLGRRSLCRATVFRPLVVVVQKSRYFLHTLSAPMHGPKKGFLNFLWASSLGEGFFHSSEGLRLSGPR